MLTADRTALALPQGTDRLLAELVQEYTGLYFDEEHTDLMLDKLAPLAVERRYASFLDYYFHLKYEGESSGEWQRVMDALSVQETYFWREMDQIRALVDIVVPRWFQEHDRPLRIWSAACASGEEPFTIAMALHEAGWLRRAPIEILASDGSVSALDRARRGTFRERSFRSLPEEIRAKYFQAMPQGWCIVPEILVRVRFQRANLVSPSEIAAFATAPVVFCRNVFIYFSPRSIRRTVESFWERMPTGGYLCVGSCESLARLTEDFALEELGGAFVYRKKARQPAITAATP